ncbi:hypothetical protein INT43_006812 [Umbelopsis isabellina]|uniref:Uncharacterized protein n=1 Tax=Mortierella isabellina TaxID=91625 RepID=A0A8H7UFG3_MORIS|nr:hypothetical protein INT43_006812 [Umbelopsis isabellina]
MSSPHSHHHLHIHHHREDENSHQEGSEDSGVSTYDKIRGTLKEIKGKVSDDPDEYQEGHDIKHPEDK